jgi:alpha-glucoside transport system substrate-binding protein
MPNFNQVASCSPVASLAVAGMLALAFVAWPADSSAADYRGPDLSGEVITITCPWTGGEGDSFRKVTSRFERATGASVKLSCSRSSEQQIVIDIKSGSPAHISVFSQPGLAANMASIGALIPLGTPTRDWVRSNYAAGDSWVDLGTYRGPSGQKDFYGIFYNVNVKSLVWFLPENFREHGYAVPQSMEALQALTKTIAADGRKPWCVGLGSDAATGWPATDWIEDLMLRLHPVDVYDGWTKNTVKFNDPRVIEAIDAYGWFARNDAHVHGGAQAVATVNFKDSPKGLFGLPPRCFMHHQGSFIQAFFPEARIDEADFFYFPTYAARSREKPLLGGGTIMTLTRDSKGARAFLAYLQHPESHEIWMAEKGYLTPLKSVNLNKYASTLARKQGQLLLDATAFRFDGSDLMPGAVGTGSFWKGMVDYSGGQSAKSVADSIQKSWDALR